MEYKFANFPVVEICLYAGVCVGKGYRNDGMSAVEIGTTMISVSEEDDQFFFCTVGGTDLGEMGKFCSIYFIGLECEKILWACSCTKGGAESSIRGLLSVKELIVKKLAYILPFFVDSKVVVIYLTTIECK